ncbi:MAG TPA: DUF4012 domain-containing protein [Acidimicrobiales bacterium]|nr:DUF4012 domain-containing protein [Acidimicrobiales bacterium]
MVGVLIVLIGIAGALSLKTVKDAKDELTQAKDLLAQVADNPSSLLNHSGRTSDSLALNQAESLANKADAQLRSSASLGFVGLFPVLHTQRNGALQLASDAGTAAGLARGLVSDIDGLASSTSLQGGQVPLTSLAKLEQAAAKATSTMASLQRGSGGLLPPLNQARDLFDKTAAKVSARLNNAASDLSAARTFMGADGGRTYLVIGENNAEMRDQGMALSYSTVTFSSGRFQTGPSADTGSIEPTAPVDVPIPAGTQAMFGGLQPTSLWQSTNATADFPWSASVMSAMYKQVTSAQVDGVIAVDVPAISQLLAVTGPVSVPGIATTLTSSNVADILLNQLYASSPTSNQQATRRDEVAAATSAILSVLKNGSSTDIVDLGNALAKSASGGHLMLWSSHPQEEKIFEHTGLGGDISSSDPQRTIHVAVENATATKLDYFIQPTVTVNVTLTSFGTAIINTKVQLDNQAPVGAAASYQLGPDGVNSFVPGQYVGRIYFWGPSVGVQPGSVPESGLRLNQTPLKVDAGQMGSVSFSTSVPDAVQNGTLRLRFVPQPRLFPDHLIVNLNAPSWRVSSGSRQVSVSWDTTTSIQWGLSSK